MSTNVIIVTCPPVPLLRENDPSSEIKSDDVYCHVLFRKILSLGNVAKPNNEADRVQSIPLSRLSEHGEIAHRCVDDDCIVVLYRDDVRV